jgi:hypothetical protein
MKLEFVPFEKIDKNKWNGTVHYAPNGNVYGYYWYLRSVVKEWDAIIEGDYQSVMPIPRANWSGFELDLIPSAGPYTVNALTENRVSEFYTKWSEAASKYSYPFNEKLTTHLAKIDNHALKSAALSSINLFDSYDVLVNNYTLDTKSEIDHLNYDDFSFSAIEKPEVFLAKEKLSHQEKNILFRLFYNAIQRGTGSCIKVINTNKNTNAFAFFISDRGKIYTAYTGRQNDIQAELLLFDTFIKNNSSTSSSLHSSTANHQIISKFGGSKSELVQYEKTSITLSQKIKEMIANTFQTSN